MLDRHTQLMYMDDTDNLKLLIKNYLIDNLISPSEIATITDSTPLISSGMVDSISTLQIVEFLEERFRIEFKPHEVSEDNLDTISLMADFVTSRQSQK